MQYNINVANGTGLDVRTNLNLAHQSLATNFSGATDPSTMSPVCAFPGSTWLDTGNNQIKVRNANDSDWIVIGTIESDGTPKLGENAINTSELAMFNKRDVITTSGRYTAPVTGWYKITVKGGGGGGGAYMETAYWKIGGGGGGEGGTTIAYERMTAGAKATVTIGAGGGASANGGNSTVVVNAVTYTGGGGKAGGTQGKAGAGGTGTINGDTGGAAGFIPSAMSDTYGAPGGGSGGGAGTTGKQGGGGNGGAGGINISVAPTAGGNGYVWFEYFDSTLNP